MLSEQGYEIGRPSKLIMKIKSTGGEITDVAVGGDYASMGEGSFLVP
ncbi:MAG: putative PhzF superfamily epimerase YddE/YHI9 [Verrucomicrobiales bacterium]|jgi:predicted PhzF superfamily epimerase YddE/YHI9